MKRIRAFLVALSATAVSGCVLGPDYERPATGQDASFSEVVDAVGLDTEGAVDERWWRSFSDPMLEALVDQAIAANTDVRAATARVREARALRRVALAGTRPSVDLDAGPTRSLQSEVGNLPPGAPFQQSIFDVGLSAAWEIDLFGRLRRGVEAADARLQATVEDRRSVLLVVLSEVALSYTDMRTAQQQRAVAERNAQVARETLELTELLAGEGLARDLDVVRARADVTELVAAQADFTAAERSAAARLAVLLGRQPAKALPELMAPSEAEFVAPRIPTGLASDLLRRRPDVRSAERRLAAATADIGIETATLFPSFRLTGGAGSLANEVDALFTSPSEAWSIAGLLSWPIFDGGRRKASIAAAEARYDAAFAQYDGAVLDALGDAEAAFASYVYAAKERQTLEAARADRERALELTRLRFEAELDDLFPVLDAQRQLLSLESRIAAAERAELVGAVNVYRALGGGWQVAEETLSAAGAKEAQ